nr:MAG TPA: hypothetical protein [Caudoviricetes sp.]
MSKYTTNVTCCYCFNVFKYSFWSFVTRSLSRAFCIALL